MGATDSSRAGRSKATSPIKLSSKFARSCCARGAIASPDVWGMRLAMRADMPVGGVLSVVSVLVGVVAAGGAVAPAPVLVAAVVDGEVVGPRAPADSAAPVRTRSTGLGSVVGTAVVGLAGIAAGIDFCATREDNAEGHLCPYASGGAVGGLLGAGLGAIAGAIIGAGLPRTPAILGQVAGVDRTLDEIGSFGVHIGSTIVLGKERTELVNLALRASFLTKLGRLWSLGPEVGHYRQQRQQRRFDGVVDASTTTLGGIGRFALPGANVTPYVLVGLGYYSAESDFGGSAAIGAEWRMRPQLALVAEGRVHGSLEALGNGAFVNTTLGAAWHW